MSVSRLAGHQATAELCRASAQSCVFGDRCAKATQRWVRAAWCSWEGVERHLLLLRGCELDPWERVVCLTLAYHGLIKLLSLVFQSYCAIVNASFYSGQLPVVLKKAITWSLLEKLVLDPSHLSTHSNDAQWQYTSFMSTKATENEKVQWPQWQASMFTKHINYATVHPGQN